MFYTMNATWIYDTRTAREVFVHQILYTDDYNISKARVILRRNGTASTRGLRESGRGSAQMPSVPARIGADVDRVRQWYLPNTLGGDGECSISTGFGTTAGR